MPHDNVMIAVTRSLKKLGVSGYSILNIIENIELFIWIYMDLFVNCSHDAVDKHALGSLIAVWPPSVSSV